jgi:hypothetical protein
VSGLKTIVRIVLVDVAQRREWQVITLDWYVLGSDHLIDPAPALLCRETIHVEKHMPAGIAHEQQGREGGEIRLNKHLACPDAIR